MAMTVWVKVMGFSDVERHSLNTIFRVSRADGPNYMLWKPEDVVSPNVALLDVDSYEAGLDLVSPGFNPHLKMIAVGDATPLGAWRALQRPVDWAALVQMLDELFTSTQEVDIDIFSETPQDQVATPPGIRCALFIGISSANAYYLRARLALAGLMIVDAVHSLEEAADRMAHRKYELAVIYVDPNSLDPWLYAKFLQDLPEPFPHVIGVMPAPDWKSVRLSESMGCKALLEVPFNPLQVLIAFQKA